MKKTYSEPIIYLWRRERAFHPFPPGGFFDEDRVIRTPVGTTFTEPVIPARITALQAVKIVRIIETTKKAKRKYPRK